MKTQVIRKIIQAALIVIITALIFIVDLFVPLGVKIWILYTVPLLIIYWKFPSKFLVPYTFFIALTFIFDIFISPELIPIKYAIINRIFGMAFFIVLVLSLKYQKRAQYYTRSLIETNLDPLLIINPNGVITDVNEAAIEATGITRDKMKGTKFPDYFTEPQKAEAGYKKVLAKGFVKDYPLMLRHTSGTKTPVLFNARTYQNENGDLSGIFAAARDVTQIKRMEDELQTIVDSVPAWIFYKDKENRFIRVNKSFAQVMKMPKDQLEGLSIYDLYPKEQALAYWKDDLEVINSVKPKRNIIEPMSIGNETLWIQTDKIPYFDNQRNCIGVISFTIDITQRRQDEEELIKHRDHLEELVRERTAKLEKEIAERVRAEDKLKQTMENLEHSNKELEQFAYVASHDLQEPLRMVSSYTQLLQKRYADKLDNDAHEFINFSVDGANRMQRLINDLLEYSRVTTRGKEFQDVDAHKALGQAVSNLQMKIEDTLAIITNEELPMVKVDESQLTRVLQNLIDNAIKYKRAENPRIHISCHLKGDYWVFSVKDNGLGIDSKYKDRIFQIFQRLYTKEEYPGTGIGLAICKRIIERHKGKIWVESEPGKGSTFLFTIKKQKGN